MTSAFRHSADPDGTAAPCDPGAAFSLRAGEGTRIGAGGLPMIVKAHPDLTGGQLLLHEQVIPAGMLVPVHRHDRAGQWTLVTQGTLHILAGDDIHVLHEGDFLYRPAGSWHAVWNAGLRPARQAEGTLPGSDMLDFFLAFAELTENGGLTPQSLAELARPYGTSYDEETTADIEMAWGVSASGGWRP